MAAEEMAATAAAVDVYVKVRVRARMGEDRGVEL